MKDKHRIKKLSSAHIRHMWSHIIVHISNMCHGWSKWFQSAAWVQHFPPIPAKFIRHTLKFPSNFEGLNAERGPADYSKYHCFHLHWSKVESALRNSPALRISEMLKCCWCFRRFLESTFLPLAKRVSCIGFNLVKDSISVGGWKTGDLPTD